MCQVCPPQFWKVCNFPGNAQYQYRSQPVKSNEPLPDPILDYVVQGVLSGTVVGKVADLPKGVKSIAIEYSDDNGLTWKTGLTARA